jgi:hypothetical protein
MEPITFIATALFTWFVTTGGTLSYVNDICKKQKDAGLACVKIAELPFNKKVNRGASMPESNGH